MASAQDMQKLDDILTHAGEQWRDEDLDDIMALLDKDYTKPQRDEDLDDIMALLDKDYTKPQQQKPPVTQKPAPVLDPVKFSRVREEKAPRRSMELPDLSSLIPQEEESDFSPLPGQLRLEPEEEEGEIRPAYDFFAPREKFAPQEEHRAGLGEQPDFSENAEKPKRKGYVILGIVALAEVAGIVAIVLWWLQWIA